MPLTSLRNSSANPRPSEHPLPDSTAALDCTRPDAKNASLGGATMPKYLFAATLTESGMQGVMKEGGTSRREALRKTAESVGGSLDAFYFAFGTNDVYLIVDAPDAASAVAASMTTTASGAVRVNTTVR